jgi:hypothetical protein
MFLHVTFKSEKMVDPESSSGWQIAQWDLLSQIMKVLLMSKLEDETTLWYTNEIYRHSDGNQNLPIFLEPWK